MEGLALLILLLGIFGLGYLIVGIMEIYYFIKNKRRKKWVNKILTDYPELKLLLSEYHRLSGEENELYKDMRETQQHIDSWVEKNKYLPAGCRVDAHIEHLKEIYQEQAELSEEYAELVKEARKNLETFWETNFPKLKEEKRIMWLE
jgi:cyclopropane fatty-acyl-phospholipid synthase-like methyltransferase